MYIIVVESHPWWLSQKRLSHSLWDSSVIKDKYNLKVKVVKFKNISKTILVALVLTTMVLAAPSLAQEEETIKTTVLGTYSFTDLDNYMLNSTTNKLEPVDTSKVEILSDTIKDLAADDDVKPAVLLSIDEPTTDLNTNESIVYAWFLTSVYGDAIIIAVSDINSTTSEVINMQFYKISPVSGDIMITRTNYDVVIEGSSGFKLSIPLENFTDPKVLIMTDASVTVSSLNYIELRALREPPSGFTLVRNGEGESTFTVSASGTLYVWFDETHQGGDVDLFIFDIQNPYYNQASHTQSWSWLVARCDQRVFADSIPYSRPLEAHGTVKFVVKGYRNPSAVSWRIAVRLSNPTTPTQPPSTTSPSTTATTPTTTASGIGLLASIQSALSNNTTMIVIAAVIIALMIAIIALRR